MSCWSGSSDQTTNSNSSTNYNSSSLSNFLSQMSQQTQSQQQQNGSFSSQTGPTAAAQAMINQASRPIGADQIAQYQNPYQQSVIDATMAQLNQQYGQQQNQLRGNAVAQGALGGDRSKIAMASLMGKQGLNTASTLGGLNSQGYTQALAAAQADRQAQLTAAGMSGTQTSGQNQQLGTSQGLTTGTSSGTNNTSTSGASNTVGQSETTGWTNPGILGLLGSLAHGGRVHYDNGGSVWPQQPQLGADGLPVWAHPGAMVAPQPQPVQQQPQKKGGQGLMNKAQNAWDKFSTGIDSGQGTALAGQGADATTGAAEAAGAGAGEAAADAGAAGAADAGAAGAAAAGEAAGAAGAGEAAGAAGAGLGAAAGEVGAGAAGAAGAAAEGGGAGAAALLALLCLAGGGAAHYPEQSHLQKLGARARNGMSAMLAGGRPHRDDGGEVLYDPYTPVHEPYPSPAGGLDAMNAVTARYDNPVPGQGESWTPPPSPSVGERPVPAPEDKGWMRSLGERIAPSYFGATPPPETMSRNPGALEGTFGPMLSDAQPAPAPAPAPAPPLAQPSPTSSDWTPQPEPVKTFRVAPDGTTIQPTATQPGLGALNAQPDPAETANTAEPGAEQIRPDMAKTDVNHMKTYVDTARQEGASDNAILGIGANVRDESGGNAGLRHPDQPKFTGEAHYAHGLFQIGGAKWNEFEAWRQENAPKSGWEDPSVQTRFVIQDLKTNQPDTWKRINEAATPGEAAQIFLHEYEKPARRYADARHEQYGRGVGSLEDLTANVPTVTNSRNASGKETRTATNGADEETPSVGKLGRLPGGAPAPVPTNAAQAPKPLFDPRGGAIGALFRGEAPPATPAGEQRGGILQRALGINFNPLGLSDNERMAMLAYSLGGQNGGALAAQTLTGLRGQDIQAQQHGAELALKAQQLAQGYAEPRVIGESYDQNTGQWHKQYGQYNAASKTYEPTTGGSPTSGGASNGPSSLDAIPPDVTGERFIEQAKKAGYSPNVLNAAQEVASYKGDPSKLASMKGEQRQIIDRLAHRINPDYDMTKYPAVAAAEKSLSSGPVSKALSGVNRLVDETTQAHDLAGKTGNSNYETLNKAYGATSSSGSQYGQNTNALKTSLNNVIESASAVAKGGGAGAEGDARRRLETMHAEMAPAALQSSLKTELAVGLANGQSNLTSYNSAHGYTPDNPKYKTVLDNMTPSQRQKAVKMLGADKIEEITGKPVAEPDKAEASATVETGVAAKAASVAPRPAGYSNIQLRQMAEKAIADGKDRAAVMKQLAAWGAAQ